MEAKGLEIFNEMPFLFWVKDEEGKYLWGKRTISQLSGEDIVGKTDYELVWAKNAETLHAADKQVFESGEPSYLHEYVDKSSHGKATVNENANKWRTK